MSADVWTPDRRVAQRRHLRWRRSSVERRQGSAYVPTERRRKLPDRRTATERRTQIV
ncbi:MAG TPA: hypothetical protein VGV12_15415 [Gemmatimonadales bacterium]|nr:hypothetical protein [Gemmatimonadales bacterium]